MAALTGWEVVIANVGDSCAYLDTGGEVVLVCFSSTPLLSSSRNVLILAYLDFTKCISISVVRLARGLIFSSACPDVSASPEVLASVHGRHCCHA